LKKWVNFIIGLALGLLGSAGIWLASSPPRGNPIQLEPAPTAARIQVHITGAVDTPGVYQLPVKSRVHDAVQAAGGFTSQANEQALNLVALLEDGAQIQVPYKENQEPFTADSNSQGQVTSGSSTSPSTGILININTATCEDLETLPGIGPVIAGAIIQHRENKGAFTGIEDIQKVPGIGPAIFEDIKAYITITDPP
jgi:competence protein ComEA